MTAMVPAAPRHGEEIDRDLDGEVRRLLAVPEAVSPALPRG
jgi:hypothetical protein